VQPTAGRSNPEDQKRIKEISAMTRLTADSMIPTQSQKWVQLNCTVIWLARPLVGEINSPSCLPGLARGGLGVGDRPFKKGEWRYRLQAIGMGQPPVAIYRIFRSNVKLNEKVTLRE
jgi:hypothetical protein